MKKTSNRLWEMEDYLDSKGCFINGLNGDPASREAYLTVINYKKLEETLKQMDRDYTNEEWRMLIDDLEAHESLSPINKLVALEITRVIFGNWRTDDTGTAK